MKKSEISYLILLILLILVKLFMLVPGALDKRGTTSRQACWISHPYAENGGRHEGLWAWKSIYTYEDDPEPYLSWLILFLIVLVSLCISLWIFLPLFLQTKLTLVLSSFLSFYVSLVIPGAFFLNVVQLYETRDMYLLDFIGPGFYASILCIHLELVLVLNSILVYRARAQSKITAWSHA